MAHNLCGQRKIIRRQCGFAVGQRQNLGQWGQPRQNLRHRDAIINQAGDLDDKYRFLVPGARIVDLGAAPGGWCQVAVKRCNVLGERGGKAVGTILGIDLQEMEPIAGCELHVLDFMADDADEQVKAWLGGKADVVMSDMAASSSGHKQTDHMRIIALCEAAAYFAFDVLEDGGTFVAKVLAGGAEGDLQKLLKQRFTKVANIKPPASRSDSSEKFVVATGFKGAQ